MDLTDEQWAVIEPFIPEEGRSPRRRPRRPGRPARGVLNGVHWILRIGAGWKDLSGAKVRSSWQ